MRFWKEEWGVGEEGGQWAIMLVYRWYVGKRQTGVDRYVGKATIQMYKEREIVFNTKASIAGVWVKPPLANPRSLYPTSSAIKCTMFGVPA